MCGSRSCAAHGCARRRRYGAVGHEVGLAFARDQANLDALAAAIGAPARTGTPPEVVAFGEVIVFSVPCRAIPAALEQAGDLSGKIVIDTTNQYGAGPMPPAGRTAAQFNAARMPWARYTKSFNTLTAGFLAEVAGRRAPSGSCSGSAATTPKPQY